MTGDSGDLKQLVIADKPIMDDFKRNGILNGELF